MQNFKNKEDVMRFFEQLDEVDDKIIEIGEIIGCLKDDWMYESFSIHEGDIDVKIYNYVYKKSGSFSIPISCLLDENYLEDFNKKKKKE